MSDPDDAPTPDRAHGDRPRRRVEDQAREHPGPVPDLESAPDGSEPGPGPDADDPMQGPAPTG